MMKKIGFVGTIMVLCMFLIPSNVSATTIGPAALPDWDGSAQVKLGWEFADPTNPQNSGPLTGWETAIGTFPTWDYNSTRVEWGNPAQWYILCNVSDKSIQKRC